MCIYIYIYIYIYIRTHVHINAYILGTGARRRDVVYLQGCKSVFVYIMVGACRV